MRQTTATELDPETGATLSSFTHNNLVTDAAIGIACSGTGFLHLAGSFISGNSKTVRQYTQAGVLNWEKDHHPVGFYTAKAPASCCCVDGGLNVIVGSRAAIVGGGPNPLRPWYVTALDRFGAFIWSRSFSGNPNPVQGAIQQIVCSIECDANAGPGNGKIWVASAGNSGSELTQLNNMGGINWQVDWAVPARTTTGVAIDEDENCYAVGSNKIESYDVNGNFRWSDSLPGGFAVAVTRGRKVIVGTAGGGSITPGQIYQYDLDGTNKTLLESTGGVIIEIEPHGGRPGAFGW